MKYALSKKFFFFIFFIFLPTTFGFSQKISKISNKEGKYGFIDYSTNELIVPYQYDEAGIWYTGRIEFYDNVGMGGYPQGEFSDGMALVYKKDQGFGFINESGIEVIPCQYKMAMRFNDGLAPVCNELGDNEKWGCIDKKGNLVIDFKYDRINVFHEGFSKISNKSGDYWKEGYINNKGKQITRVEYDNDSQGQFSEGLACVAKNGKYGYIDQDGEVVIPLQYERHIGDQFYEGYAVVRKNGKDGVIDKTGRIVIEFLYDELHRSTKDLLIAKKREKYGIVNINKTITAPFKYNAIRSISSTGGVFVASIGNEHKFGIFRINGENIVPCKYSRIDTFNDGTACAERNGKWGAVNMLGEEIIPCIYDDCLGFGNDGLCYVKKGDSYSVVDMSGELLIPWGFENNEVIKKRSQLAKTVSKSPVDKNIPMTNVRNTKTFAIIIANENYLEKNIGDVQYAKRDGQVFREYCEKTLGVPSENIHYKENATYNQIKAELNWGKKIAEAHNGSAKFIVYYAGHGVPNEKTNESNILPSDGALYDLSTSYPLKEVYSILGSYNSKQVVVITDACFSGTKRDGSMLMSSTRGVAIKAKQEVKADNLIVISSTKGDETAHPYDEHKHGMMTYFLLKYLKENYSHVKIGGLVDFIKDNVGTTSLIINNVSQTPTVVVSPNLSNWRDRDL